MHAAGGVSCELSLIRIKVDSPIIITLRLQNTFLENQLSRHQIHTATTGLPCINQGTSTDPSLDLAYSEPFLSLPFNPRIYLHQYRWFLTRDSSYCTYVQTPCPPVLCQGQNVQGGHGPWAMVQYRDLACLSINRLIIAHIETSPTVVLA